MPLNFLQSIKLSGSIEVGLIGEYSEHIFDMYTFSCRDLSSSQLLFNDGIPSIIFMPQKSDFVCLEKKEGMSRYGSAWVCCGIVENTYWNIPTNIDFVTVLRFNPASFYSLFNISPAVFFRRPICSLCDIVNDKWMDFFDQMYEKETLLQKASYLNTTFSLYHTESNFPYILNMATSYIESEKGNVTISNVLQRLGQRVNAKWLHRNFVKYIGISPKRYILLQRFIYAYQYCMKSKSKDFFDAALYSGYYDYNHFFKEFKRYTGVGPAQYTWD